MAAPLTAADFGDSVPGVSGVSGVPEVAAPRSTQNHVYRYRLHVDRLLLLAHTQAGSSGTPLAHWDLKYRHGCNRCCSILRAEPPPGLLDNVRLTAVWIRALPTRSLIKDSAFTTGTTDGTSQICLLDQSQVLHFFFTLSKSSKFWLFFEMDSMVCHYPCSIPSVGSWCSPSILARVSLQKLTMEPDNASLEKEKHLITHCQFWCSVLNKFLGCILPKTNIAPKNDGFQ